MKKTIKFVTAIIITLSLFTILQKPQQASALASYWKKSHWVTLKKDVTVYKLSNTNWGQKLSTHTAKAGSHYKLSHWDVNYNWVLQSGKYNTGNKYTYMVNKKYNDSSWFKMGIHKLSHYRAFHGYRVITLKSDTSYNTFYDKETHATLSNLSPLQKSKVIFEYGSHVYPTAHEWDKIVGNYFTPYHYKNGSWHKGKTDYVSD